MAFDGITTRKVVEELAGRIVGCRVDKIYQPESDAVVLALRKTGETCRLLMSAQADSARLYLTMEKPETPLEPPTFCMLFRKHFGAGKVVSVGQVGFDRIVDIAVETYNELGDLCVKHIILEMMGRHSNLMLVDENGRIIDCVHHVGQGMSHFRAVLPGLPYEHPSHNHRANPLETADLAAFAGAFAGAEAKTLERAFGQAFDGISPFAAREICFRAHLSERETFGRLGEGERDRLFGAFTGFFDEVKGGKTLPVIYLEGDRMVEYSMIRCRMMEGTDTLEFDTPSMLLDAFYVPQDGKNRLKQRSQDLHKLLRTHEERVQKKLALQEGQLKDAAGKEIYRHYGDLITAYIYLVKGGEEKLVCEDFYEDPPRPAEVPLDPHKTPSQNAQKYYNRYNKLKRTEEAVTVQIAETREEAAYLESMFRALEIADCEKDIENIRQELAANGYIRKSRGKKRNLRESRPLEYTTSEGLAVRVGKNNVQNDELTFRMATPFDLWLHVKDVPGSHVILFCGDRKKGENYTDKSIEEAAAIAAGHSSVSGDTKVTVDYTERRYVKKPAGSKPGYVHYTHQKSIVVEPRRH